MSLSEVQGWVARVRNNSSVLVFGIFVGLIIALITNSMRDDQYLVHIESYKMGQAQALDTSNPSWELENACVTLWMREQHRENADVIKRLEKQYKL